jgi:hypothetical protein
MDADFGDTEFEKLIANTVTVYLINKSQIRDQCMQALQDAGS